MIKYNTLTFEQVESNFHKWAKRFCNKYFEYWELINEVWLNGGVRFLPQSKIKCASKCIKYDMIDYMRNVSGGRRKSHFHNESDLRSKDDDGVLWNVIEVKGEDIERKNFIEFFTNHPSLSRIEKLIMKLTYLDGFSQPEVGKVCGLSASRISQIHSNLITRFRGLDYSKIL